MTNNTQSRKWQITINNPEEKGFSHEKIKEIMKGFKSCVYYCMSDEIGENGTFHTHLFFSCSSAVRFSTIMKKFEGGHFEMCQGNCQQNRDYVYKEGKWKNTEKKSTNFVESHFECGEMPVERQGKRNDLEDLYDMIKSGMSNFEIIECCPQYLMNIDKIEHCRQVIREEMYKNTRRNVTVTYIYGGTGTGKTRFVMDKYGDCNVYRVSDYLHPFDSYKGQDIVVFEEFRSDIKIGDMLKYLDIYACELPCRYNNKVACYTKVYIISNIDLYSQYPNVQLHERMTWDAFIRRINEVFIFTKKDRYELTTDEYLNDFIPCIVSPFGNDKINDNEYIKRRLNL